MPGGNPQGWTPAQAVGAGLAHQAKPAAYGLRNAGATLQNAYSAEQQRQQLVRHY